MGAEMLTKFESKSSRVKGVSFHPKRPWLLCSLHNGTIQLWDYRIGALLNRFEEHDGPVRAVDFHPSRSMFASGGDDYKIKVWNFKHVLYTLSGHLDYVRTVEFHPNDLPWILSCSDDQTIRIWNWQSRNCMAILTGHNHYVMCATWHPRDELIASASLDQTVRVWDYSGLRKKHSTPQNQIPTFEEQMQRSMQHGNPQAGDIFGNTDATVKYVLEGHDRGVNWVSFHPTLPLLVSAGDDRLIKIWRMSETKAWEVDTCRGHFNNASAALFHKSQDLILSVGEDKTIRVWDANKRTAVQSFRRENDRFWVIAAHPTINLFAAGHDNGVMVFKLERERPAYTIHQNTLVFVTKDKFVKTFDLNTSTESPNLISLRKLGQPWNPPRTISFNPADRSVLVSSSADGGLYELINLPRDGSVVDGSEAKRGSGTTAVWVARNRFAVFNKDLQTIDIKDLSNAVTRSIKPPVAGVLDIHYGGTGNLLLCTQTQVVLYDIQKKETVAELTTPFVKYVYWNADGSQVALLGKHTITIATKTLEQVCAIHETIRIKSAVWDDTLGVLLYSTLNHVKYLLPGKETGDTGVIRTLANTVYLIRVRGKTLTCLTRGAKCESIAIDSTEYRFKVALAKKEYKEMVRIIKTSNLVGQSIIGYLQKKGFPEIALQFVQEPQARFELAVECGNLSVAVEMARQLDQPALWTALGQAALLLGNIQIVELAFQKMKNFEKLSFLYLITGDQAKLERMGKIAEHRGDHEGEFQNSLWTGNVESRIRIFKELDLYPLAYATAKTHGLEEECAAILEAAGISEEDIVLPEMEARTFDPPKPIEPMTSNWPLLPTSRTILERALTEEMGDLSLEDSATNGYADDLNSFEKGLNGEAALIDIGEGEGEGWEDGNDEVEGWEIEGEKDDEMEIDTSLPTQAMSDAEYWVNNSPLAAHHIAAGSFESAMQLLNRQVGAVNFEPLKPKFLQLYQSSKTYLEANTGLPPMEIYVKDTTGRSRLPRPPVDYENIKTVRMRDALKMVTANKLEDAIVALRDILHTLLLSAAASKSEADEVAKTVETIREYIIGLSTEVTRRNLDVSTPEGIKRNLELAAYFTHFQLTPQHRGLAYMQAMTQFNKYKNIATAGVFAQKYIALGIGRPDAIERAKKIIALAQRNTRDTIEIDYDQFEPFSVCAASYTPISRGSAAVTDPFTGALYKPEYKGEICRVTGITEIGAPATGFRVLI